MNNEIACGCYRLNYVIVRNGLGSKVLTIAKDNDIPGGTIILGKGTAKNSILRFLELADYHKEIALVITKGEHSDIFLRDVSEKLKFHKPNTGIAFSIPIAQVIGCKYCEGADEYIIESGGGSMKKYNSIFSIVDRGNASIVVEAANEAGARGATIIHARGSGIHETSKIFSFEIEPEKEIVLILVEEDMTQKVCDFIMEKSSIDQPGRGIMFVQNVDKVYGLREAND